VTPDQREHYFERYAMQAEQMCQDSESALRGVSVDTVSEAVGLSRDDGREVANYLRELGWAKVSYAGDKPILVLTFAGYREIAMLRRPAWRRWIDRHPQTMNVIWMTLTGVVAGVVSAVIVYYLLPSK
jgi:hypothetical protein